MSSCNLTTAWQLVNSLVSISAKNESSTSYLNSWMPGFNPTNAISNVFLFGISSCLKDGKGTNNTAKLYNYLQKYRFISFETLFLAIFKAMRMNKKWVLLVFLLLLAVGIHFFSVDKNRVEAVFSTQIYHQFSQLLRFLFGWIPFSAGDILYGFCIIWFMTGIYKLFRLIKRKQFNREKLFAACFKTIRFFFFFYIVFNAFWGINYNRIGIGEQLGITISKYSTDELKAINLDLLARVNESKTACLQLADTTLTTAGIFSQAVVSYHQIANRLPYLNYQTVSVKSSVWGWLGNYLGFGGYYNPFTGEAQVNTMVPGFLQPFTTCHEIAHQLGYAKEDEANFVGYLAASNSKDPRFQYSVYLDMFMYANRNLVEADTVAAKSFASQLQPAVKADIQTWKAFNQRHKNPVEPVINWLYGKYLQGNEQPAGLLSYDEVTGFIIAYKKKFGRI